MTLDEYIGKMSLKIVEFKKNYLDQAKRNPGINYPLSMNAEDWDRQFDILRGDL